MQSEDKGIFVVRHSSDCKENRGAQLCTSLAAETLETAQHTGRRRDPLCICITFRIINYYTHKLVADDDKLRGINAEDGNVPVNFLV